MHVTVCVCGCMRRSLRQAPQVPGSVDVYYDFMLDISRGGEGGSGDGSSYYTPRPNTILPDLIIRSPAQLIPIIILPGLLLYCRPNYYTPRSNCYTPMSNCCIITRPGSIIIRPGSTRIRPGSMIIRPGSSIIRLGSITIIRIRPGGIIIRHGRIIIRQ